MKNRRSRKRRAPRSKVRTSARNVRHDPRRKGMVAVFVAIMLVVLFGMAALSVDVGMMYNAKADLQRAADAAAMAAAAALVTPAAQMSTPESAAKAAALEYVNNNPVLGHEVTIDVNADVQLGRGNFDSSTSTYHFTPGTLPADAVRVTVRMTDGSPNGPLPLFFAKVLGKRVTNVQATATASVAPRDIALTVDTSGSTLFDSMFSNYENRTINLYDVWDKLQGGYDDAASLWQPDELPADLDQAAGPAWGFMRQLGFGGDPADSGYDHRTDPGLIQLSDSGNWSDAKLDQYLADKGYSSEEIEAITEASGSGSHGHGYGHSYSNSSSYDIRVAIALGLAEWNSGIPGGLWESKGVPASQAGNGNDSASEGELVWVEPFLSENMSDSADSWMDYINWIKSRSPHGQRYGVKTMLDFVMDQRRDPDRTPELKDIPLEPMESIKNGTDFLIDLLVDLNAADQISLEAYSTVGVHQQDLTNDFELVRTKVRAVAPGMHGGATNMGAGLERAIEELTSDRTRAAAKRVILLMTDGQANVDDRGRSSTIGARQYAEEQARRAADLGISIVSLSVGQDADRDLMEELASIGNGVHYHAEGTIEEYRAQLEAIFAQIGGRRSVTLIE